MMRCVVAIAGLMIAVSTSLCSAQDARISTTVDALLETLKRPCEFNFSSATLDEVAVAIEQQFKVNVIVQEHAFEQIGLKEVRITYRVNGISLRSALLSMLEEFYATFAIRWESIVLTTQDQAESYWRPAVYAVSDLVSKNPPNHQSPSSHDVYDPQAFADFDPLIQLIQTSVAPDTWSGRTGPSSDCIGITVGDTHLLIVKQSESTHAEIERLLAGIRRRLSDGKRQNTEQ